MRFTLVLAAASLFAGCSAPTKATQPVAAESPVAAPEQKFILGERSEDLHKRLAVQLSSLNRNGQEEFPLRSTPAGAVKPLVAYALDDSESHLSPTVRVQSVNFVFDKDVNLRTALGSIAELRELCAMGCDLFVDTAGIGRVRPVHPSTEQVELAASVAKTATYISSDPAKRAAASTHSYLMAYFTYSRAHRPIEFESTPVAAIEILVQDARRDKLEQKIYQIAGAKFQHLPEWRP